MLMNEFQKIVGKSVEAAQRICPDNRIRVIRRDGKDVICLRDYSPDRVNVEEVEGLITKVVELG